MEAQDVDLVDRAAGGDAAAFRLLVERHAPRLYAVCLRITADPHAAEDAVQEAFLNAYRALPGFVGRSQVTTWLHRIAVNAALGTVRRERGWASRRQASAFVPDSGGDAAGMPPGLVDESTPGPEREAASALAGEATVRAMRQLSELERIAFVLRHFEQLAVREIAEQIGVGEGAVKQAVLRAVRKLRASLAAHREITQHA